jgi:hypothetical protein
VIGPDVAEDEGPDADEDVDKDLHGRGRRQNPAGLILDAFGSGLGVEGLSKGEAQAFDGRST